MDRQTQIQKTKDKRHSNLLVAHVVSGFLIKLIHEHKYGSEAKTEKKCLVSGLFKCFFFASYCITLNGSFPKTFCSHLMVAGVKKKN